MMWLSLLSAVYLMHVRLSYSSATSRAEFAALLHLQWGHALFSGFFAMISTLIGSDTLAIYYLNYLRVVR